MGDKPDYYTMKGFVAFIKKENCMYTVSMIAIADVSASTASKCK